MPVNPHRLYRSHDRMLAGVAGGMGEYLDVDPTLVRIGWIVVGFASAGLALIAYVLLAIVVPMSPYPQFSGMWQAPAAPSGWPNPQPAPGGAWQAPASAPTVGATQASAWTNPPAGVSWQPQAPMWRASTAPRPASRGLGAAVIVGVVLVVIGVIALADAALPGIHAGVILGPAVLIALGAGLLAASVRRSPAAGAATPIASTGAATPTADTSAAAADFTPWTATDQAPVEPSTQAPTAADVAPGDDPAAS
jgi:phage shock protein C